MAKRGLVTVLAALALAAPAAAGGPGMLVGVAEDNVKQGTLAEAKAKLELARLAGFGAVRVTSTWAPGETAPPAAELAQLRHLASAAELAGVRVFVQVMNAGSRTTPLTAEARAEFATYAASIPKSIFSLSDFVIGNEPNLNRFWMPQFNPDGSNAAAAAYVELLTAVYDALKAVDARIQVLGGAVSPRGVDRPNTGRDTHSPSTFIPDMGAAYRAGGRTLPIMDAFAFHPYQDNSSQPPSFEHPRSSTVSLADYRKLVALLSQAFDGTAQPGSTLPIYYTEYGIESTVPPDKAGLYTGREPATTRPSDPATQGGFYREALALAFCQPNVRGVFILHTEDEADFDRFQSGVYYPDGTPKPSLAPVRAAARQVRGGVVARCPGLELTPRVRIARAEAPTPAVRVTCDLDCVYYLRLEKLPARSTTFARRGRALAGVPVRIVFPPAAPGRYRFTARATAPVNVGPPATVAGRAFSVESRG